MKNVLLFLALMTVASNSFAMHIYRSEECKSRTHQVKYEGNYPIGGYYSLAKIKDETDDNKVLMIPLDESEGYSEEDIKDMIGFNVGKLIKIAPTKKTSEECFKTTTSKFIQTFKFSNLKKEDELKLGIKNGEKMLFKCVETYDFPDQDNCN